MTEQSKLDEQLEIWSKVFHPNRFDQLRTQINKAMSEYQEETEKKALDSKLLQLLPDLKAYENSKNSMGELRKLYRLRLIEKIDELYT